MILALVGINVLQLCAIIWVNSTNMIVSKGRQTQKSAGCILPWSSKSGKMNLCSSFGSVRGGFWGSKEGCEILETCWFLFWVPVTLVCSLCKNSLSCTPVICELCCMCVIDPYKMFMNVLQIPIKFLWKWGLPQIIFGFFPSFVFSVYINFKIMLSVLTAKSWWDFAWDCIEFIY